MLSYFHFPLLLPMLMDGLHKKHERDAYYYRYQQEAHDPRLQGDQFPLQV